MTTGIWHNEIVARQIEMAGYFNAGEFSNIVDHVFHPKAKLYGPNQPVLEGRQTLIEFLREEQKDETAILSFHTEEIINEGKDLAIAIGRYNVHGSDGSTHLHSGKFFQVYQRDDDGQIKLIREMWSE